MLVLDPPLYNVNYNGHIVKTVKLAIWAVSLNFLFDFTLFVIDIQQIMLISLFPTPFDHFHFHLSGGLILWYDLRLWLISNYISNCIKIYHRCCRFYQIISPLLAIIWNEIFEENYSSYFSLQFKCLRTNHQGNAWKIKRENI